MKPLAHGAGVLLEEPEYFGSHCFAKAASQEFPMLAAELAANVELIHLQISTLGTAARGAIESDDFDFLEGLFQFLNRVLAQPKLHPEIENAIAISFLSPNEFESSESGRQAWRLLPDGLKHVLKSDG